MKISQYKYFDNVLKNAEFTEEKCQVCSTEKKCLEGEYFDQGSEVTSVCLECLNKGMITVDIPQFIKDRIYLHIEGNLVSKSKEEIEKLSTQLIETLSKTPPVPWIQYNDWPVCCCNFAKYLGEWNREDINNNSTDGDGKKYLMSILDDFTKSKVDDIDILWDDIGQYTAVFVFECIECSKRIAVCQSY
ncbi:MAG: CbrC family protein [Halanaerobiales bacterium]|nr:CbrC family protein [Halanaerobiales bacterium]